VEILQLISHILQSCCL